MSDKKRIAVFPDDFIQRAHPVLPGITQWLLENNEDSESATISVVGGEFDFFPEGTMMAELAPPIGGDGRDTFEMWDFQEENPRRNMSAKDINEYLRDNKFQVVDKSDPKTQKAGE